MQDFTKLESQKLPATFDLNNFNKGFIRSRMNKDNFWNLMFFVGLNFGFGISYLIISLAENGKYPISASMVFWLTILGVPYLVKRNSGITFDQEKL